MAFYKLEVVREFQVVAGGGLTHVFLETVLGTDRPTIRLAAGILQKKKLIKYPREAVKILNRAKLERSACECYGIIQQLNGGLGLK